MLKQKAARSMDTNGLNAAIPIFIGVGSSSFPSRDKAKLVENFGEQAADVLSKKIENLLNEITRMEIDWSDRSLAEGGEIVREIVGARHPELSSEALNALIWDFTYNWR